MQLPVFRFDDVSINTDSTKLHILIGVIQKRIPNVLLAISPIVFAGVGERVHPPKLTAMSTLDPYYEGIKCGLPDIVRDSMTMKGVRLAGHGLAHVDHRLLGYKAQEMSILMSCSLARTSIFIPPYNHWNEKTEAICKKHRIDLVRFEDGWLHALHNPFMSDYPRWYGHPYDMTPSELEAWFS